MNNIDSVREDIKRLDGLLDKVKTSVSQEKQEIKTVINTKKLRSTAQFIYEQLERENLTTDDAMYVLEMVKTRIINENILKDISIRNTIPV